MIRKLRTRFVIFNMLIVAVMLLSMMYIAIRFNRYTLRQQSIALLERIAAVPSEMAVTDLVPPEELPAVWFVVTKTQERTLEVRGSAHLDQSDPKLLEELLREVDAKGKTDGTLRERSLRYYRTGSTVAFADVTGELQLIRGIRNGWYTSISIIFVGFFLVSLVLSHVMTHPVDRAWKQQRQFIADASHELKTPLSVIMANAELLQSEENEPARNILATSYQMRSLVERMLEMARVDSMKAKRKPLDFSQLVSDATLSVQLLFEEKGRPLTADIPEDIWVRGNEHQLYQLLDVLLDNALKYSDGDGAVEVTLKRQRRSCLLAVTSPGEPLTRRQQKDVFKRFYRVDPARSRCGSYGLGLAIAWEIAASHRGGIRAQGKDRQNTFLVTLPTCKIP